jgi:hypothetical protein
MAERSAFLEDVRQRLEQAQAVHKRFYDAMVGIFLYSLAYKGVAIHPRSI